MSYRFEASADESRMRALSRPMQELAALAGSTLPFHFLPIPLAWFRHFHGPDGIDFGARRGRNFLGARSRLEAMILAAAWDGESLAAAAPMAEFTVALKRNAPPVRLLTFCSDSVTIFYQDLLVRNEDRPAVLGALMQGILQEAARRGGSVFLGHIPSDSPNLAGLAQAVEAARARGWQGGIITNRSRGGIYPWTAAALSEALRRLRESGRAASADAAIEAYLGKLEAQAPALMGFPATRLALEKELGGLLEAAGQAGATAEDLHAIRSAIASETIPYPFLKLPADAEGFYAGLSSSRRYYFRRYLRKFEDAGGVFEEVPPSSLRREDLDEYLALHQARWGADSVAVNDLTLGFHRDIGMEGAASGIFRLFFARLSGRRVAAHACFDVGDRREYLFSGRLPEAEEARAGKMLVLHTVLDAIAKGFKTYDFGYGGDEYKSEFTKAFRTARSVFLAPPGTQAPDLDLLFPKYEYMALEPEPPPA